MRLSGRGRSFFTAESVGETGSHAELAVAGKRAAVRIEEHDRIAGDEGWKVGEMVGDIEALQHGKYGRDNMGSRWEVQHGK